MAGFLNVARATSVPALSDSAKKAFKACGRRPGCNVEVSGIWPETLPGGGESIVNGAHANSACAVPVTVAQILAAPGAASSGTVRVAV